MSEWKNVMIGNLSLQMSEQHQTNKSVMSTAEETWEHWLWRALVGCQQPTGKEMARKCRRDRHNNRILSLFTAPPTHAGTHTGTHTHTAHTHTEPRKHFQLQVISTGSELTSSLGPHTNTEVQWLQSLLSRQ